MRQVGRRSVMAGLGAVALGGTAASQQFRSKELVAQGFGGPTQDVLQRVVFDVFDKREGSRSTQVPLQSAAAFARMRQHRRSTFTSSAAVRSGWPPPRG